MTSNIYLRKFSSFYFLYIFCEFFFVLWYSIQQFYSLFLLLIKNMNGTLLADTCVVVDVDDDGCFIITVYCIMLSLLFAKLFVFCKLPISISISYYICTFSNCCVCVSLNDRRRELTIFYFFSFIFFCEAACTAHFRVFVCPIIIELWMKLVTLLLLLKYYYFFILNLILLAVFVHNKECFLIIFC